MTHVTTYIDRLALRAYIHEYGNIIKTVEKKPINTSEDITEINDQTKVNISLEQIVDATKDKFLRQLVRFEANDNEFAWPTICKFSEYSNPNENIEKPFLYYISKKCKLSYFKLNSINGGSFLLLKMPFNTYQGFIADLELDANFKLQGTYVNSFENYTSIPCSRFLDNFVISLKAKDISITRKMYQYIHTNGVIRLIPSKDIIEVNDNMVDRSNGIICEVVYKQGYCSLLLCLFTLKVHYEKVTTIFIVTEYDLNEPFTIINGFCVFLLNDTKIIIYWPTCPIEITARIGLSFMYNILQTTYSILPWEYKKTPPSNVPKSFQLYIYKSNRQLMFNFFLKTVGLRF